MLNLEIESQPLTTQGLFEAPSKSAAENLTWKTLFKNLIPKIALHSHPEFVEGLNFLSISEKSVPETECLNKALKKLEWSVVDTETILTPSEFFTLLGQKKIAISKSLRTLSDASFSPYPDRFHDVFGHLPLLLNREYREFLETFGKISKSQSWSQALTSNYKTIAANPTSSNNYYNNFAELSTLSDEKAVRLERLFWWTIEFGLISKSKDLTSIAGAALLSSNSEIEAYKKNQFKKLSFNQSVYKMPYHPSAIQNCVFVAQSFTHWLDILETI